MNRFLSARVSTSRPGSSAPPAGVVLAEDTLAVRWNDVLLECGAPQPPRAAHGRPRLRRVHTCGYDAWAAYDPVALGTRPVPIAPPAPRGADEPRTVGRRSASPRTQPVRPLPAQGGLSRPQMADLGYDPDERRGPAKPRDGGTAAQAVRTSATATARTSSATSPPAHTPTTRVRAGQTAPTPSTTPTAGSRCASRTAGGP